MKPEEGPARPPHPSHLHQLPGDPCKAQPQHCAQHPGVPLGPPPRTHHLHLRAGEGERTVAPTGLVPVPVQAPHRSQLVTASEWASLIHPGVWFLGCSLNITGEGGGPPGRTGSPPSQDSSRAGVGDQALEQQVPSPLGPQFLHLRPGEGPGSADPGGPSHPDVLALKGHTAPQVREGEEGGRVAMVTMSWAGSLPRTRSSGHPGHRVRGKHVQSPQPPEEPVGVEPQQDWGTPRAWALNLAGITLWS